MSGTSNKLFKVKQSSLKMHHDTANVTDEEVLLLEAPKETDEVFRKLRMPSKASFVKREMKEINEINAIENIFEGLPVFKGKYMKKLCNSHFLQILMVDQLYAYIPEEAAKIILDFTGKFKKTMMDTEFYILAPREYFTKAYDGKPAETYIIFYREHMHSSSDSYDYVRESDNCIQLYASGNDFDDNRRLMKHTDSTIYNTDSNSFSKRGALIAVAIFMVLSIVLLFSSIMTGSLMSLALALTLGGINLIEFNSDKFWNEK
ncbi:MAG: hypothetical protein KUG64_10490 [Cycloclasticus sp.]|nr:hypothetical protein [Cycloclasticus sp.]